LGRRPLGAILHSSNEPGELSQWLCHDDSTINIVVLIIIIIIIISKNVRHARGGTFPGALPVRPNMLHFCVFFSIDNFEAL